MMWKSSSKPVSVLCRLILFRMRWKGNNVMSHADLQMDMDGIKADADGVMVITVRFKVKDTPEGVARLMDEYNKQI
ncbi:MAG: DUF2589 domain-containing protein [Parabacteroides sp.]|nr:DUF2589 domain-containing protein [Parabacteroides sp.]